MLIRKLGLFVFCKVIVQSSMRDLIFQESLYPVFAIHYNTRLNFSSAYRVLCNKARVADNENCAVRNRMQKTGTSTVCESPEDKNITRIMSMKRMKDAI